MFKGNITAGSVSANTNVPITQVFNTNQKVGLNGNQVEILRGGLWDIDSTINFTASGTSTVANLLINGNIAQSVNLTTEASSNYQIVFEDAEIVKNTPYSAFVEIAIQFTSQVTVLGGEIIVKYES